MPVITTEPPEEDKVKSTAAPVTVRLEAKDASREIAPVVKTSNPPVELSISIPPPAVEAVIFTASAVPRPPANVKPPAVD